MPTQCPLLAIALAHPPATGAPAPVRAVLCAPDADPFARLVQASDLHDAVELLAFASDPSGWPDDPEWRFAVVLLLTLPTHHPAIASAHESLLALFARIRDCAVASASDAVIALELLNLGALCADVPDTLAASVLRDHARAATFLFADARPWLRALALQAHRAVREAEGARWGLSLAQALDARLLPESLLAAGELEEEPGVA